MAISGSVIENPVIGDRVVFLQTSRDTGGALLQLDIFARAGAQGPPEHIHPQQEERFTVLAGSLTGRIAGREVRIEPGTEWVVPAGTPHTWHNAGESEVHVRVELRPAGRMEPFLETIYGLAKDGKTNARGIPSLFQLAVFATAYFDTNYLASPPLPVQKVMLGAIAFVGRRLGFRPDYPYPYSAPGNGAAP